MKTINKQAIIEKTQSAINKLRELGRECIADAIEQELYDNTTADTIVLNWIRREAEKEISFLHKNR